MTIQFLAPPVDSLSDRPKVVVIPAPYEATTSYGKGTAHGPHAILEASHQVEYYDEELESEAYRVGLTTRAPIVFDGLVGADAVAQVESAVREAYQAAQWPIVLGGEHSITSGAVRACREVYPDVGVVQIDAHGDLRDTYEGTPWSHASVMRRIVDLGCPTVGVGLRSLCAEERTFIRERQLPRWYAFAMAANDRWIDEAIAATPEHCFVTLDVDGLDPSIIRATGTPEPGGIGWYPLLTFLRRLCAERTVVGADVVELAPVAGDHTSNFTVARLVYKMIGYWAEGAKGC